MLEQFECVRVTDLTGIDVGHFDFDRDLTVFMFILNADEDIYLRYGGRDDGSADTYLNTESLIRALQQGLDLHQRFQAGEWQSAPRAEPRFPRDYPQIKREQVDQGNCVHCHMIGAGDTRTQQSAGTLDKLVDLWVYPDIKRLGLELDVREGLELKKVTAAGKQAGLRKRDQITSVAGEPVYSFADLQYALHRLPREAQAVSIGVQRRDELLELSVELAENWRVTRIGRRSNLHALTPFPEFWGRELEVREKRDLGLDADAFACEVTKFWVNTNGKRAGLRVGDIVYAVDGVRSSPLTAHPSVYIRLHYETGDRPTLHVVRGRQQLELTFELRARPW